MNEKMSLVVRTLPLATAAAFFPAGLATLLWLLGLPRGRVRGLVYFAGAVLSTVGSGGAILILLRRALGLPDADSPTFAAVRLASGAVLVGIALYLIATRRSQPGRRGGQGEDEAPHFGRIFLLGVVMWTPSMAYVAALDLLARADLSLPATVMQLVLVDLVVLSMLEVPLFLAYVAPGWAGRRLEELVHRLSTHGRLIAGVVAGGGGVYLTAIAVGDLIQS